MRRLYSFIASLNEKYESDKRLPLWFLSIPSIPYVTPDALTLGITGMDPMYWLLAFAMLSLQSVVNIIVAVTIYETILKRRNDTISYLVGYGIICPLILYWPLFVLKLLDVHNVTFMVCIAMNGPALLVFRCMEAMHGVLPPFAYDTTKRHDQNKLSKFVMYYASTISFNFNPKTDYIQYVSKSEMRERLLHFARVFLEATLLFSFMIPYNYLPFPYRRPVHHWYEFLYWGNLCNNFIMAYLTSVCMEAGVTGLAILTSLLTGISTSKFNDEPLLSSASPSDFWGRRWNIIVGSALRRGVYRPLRKNRVPRLIAAFVTFIASGCLHEYVLFLLALRGGRPNNPTGEVYAPRYGNHWIFFIWNGFVLIGEYVLQGTVLIRFLQTNIPKPIRTLLVLLTVIPISHLFTDEYIQCSFYSDISLGFPRLKIIQ